MATPQEIEAFIRSARPPWNPARQAYDWYGYCAGLTFRTIYECGGETPDGAYQSAWLAYLAAKAAGRIESTDSSKAPAGACHYWDYTDSFGNRYGHVTLDIFGRGTDTLSATGFAHEVWARSAGLISVAAQSARPGMRYVGWARTYGRNNRISISTGTAGGGSSPLDPKGDDVTLTAEQAKKLDDLWQALLPGEAGVKTQGAVQKQIVDTLTAARGAQSAANSAREAVTAHAEEYTADWLHANPSTTPPRPAGRLRALLDKIVGAVEKPPAATVDVDAIAAAIVAKLPKTPGTPTAAEIAKAVNDEAAKRLAS